MKKPKFPILDDHIHIDPRNGRGIEAAKDFLRSGGTHLCLVSKPSWSLGIHPINGTEFTRVFDETIRVAEEIRSIGIIVFPILGVHPAELTMLMERMDMEAAVRVMKTGLTIASRYVMEGKAIGLKSGRPHYEITDDLREASNDVLSHALTLAGETGCSLQIHAESGPCSDIPDRARACGMDPSRIIKHYATPDTPLHPSFIAKHESVPVFCSEKRPFTMESDYMDENTRPGAVMGPKSVPRNTLKLHEEGLMSEEDIYRIHADVPMRLYGCDISL